MTFLGENLIFLISQPRAGSTLLQRILAGHPKVHTSAEPWLMLHPLYALKETGSQAEYDSQLAYTALQDFLNHYCDGEATYIEAIRKLAGVLYGRALQDTGKEFFLDKTPRYYFIIPELMQVFPSARFVFLIRNPFAVLWSILTTWVRTDFSRLAKFRQDLLAAPENILEGIQKSGRDAIVVRYEELVSHPGKTVSALCQKLDLDFQETMLVYGEQPDPKGRMGDQIGIRQYGKPSAEGLDNWMGLASSSQMRHFALAYLHDLGERTVEELGYSLSELKEQVEGVELPASGPIVPWDIATRSSATWTPRERLSFNRAVAVQQHGWLQGHLRFLKQGCRALLR